MASATNPTLVTIVARVVLFCHGIPTQLLVISASTYKSPVFIGLLGVMSVAVVLLLHHCILVTCCNARARDRRQRRRASAAARGSNAQPQQPQDDASYSVDLSSSSRVQLVQAAVVCRYQKEEEWNEPTCPVCLADFADGEAVRVLPECMHYFHADCIDTWLSANTSCPMCRAETTPTPTPTPSPGSLHRQLSLSISLEDVPVRT